MVNRRIFVVGFGLYGSIHGPAEYTVNIQVCNCRLVMMIWENVDQKLEIYLKDLWEG